MNIQLEEDIHEQLLPYMLNWEKVRSKISAIDNQILQTGNVTVRNKLHYALMHWTILGQAYRVSGSATSLVQRAMTENIILNLVSSLEAFAHVINQIYNFQLKPRGVAIDHLPNHKRSKKKCLRCELRGHDDQLAEYLDSELVRDSTPPHNWYESLVRYRHQIVHRTLFLINQRVGEGSFLPDDPFDLTPSKMYYDNEKNMPVITNYTENREVREYTLYLFERVFRVVEASYHHLYTNL